MFESVIRKFLSDHGYISADIKAALIDMDGTLYDSMPNHADAWMQMTSEIGLHPTRNEFFSYEGRTGASTINLLFNRELGRDATPEEIERLYRRKTEIFAAMPPVSPMPGAREMTTVLRKAGITCVLVTGSGQSTLINRIPADYPEIFSESMRVTSRDVKHGKPHPEPFLKGMQLSGANPGQCMVIENAPLGVQAGVASGAFTIAVNTGPIPEAELRDAGAHVVFGSMPECAEMMPTLLHDMNSVSLKS